MGKAIFEIDENGDVLYTRRFLWFSKTYIVNDVEKQKKLIKLLEAKNTLLDTGINTQGFMPIIYVYFILGIPIHLIIRYFLPKTPNEFSAGLIFIIISCIFIWDYNHQIDKILKS